jgi:tetratricopeptide (TPR) repeat protein
VGLILPAAKMMDVFPTASEPSLAGRRICLAGRFLAMTHAQLAELITAHGGIHLRHPRRCNFALVIGEDGWPARPDGSPLRALQYAARVKALGFDVEWWQEREFFERLGLANADDAGSRFTLSDLARILGVSGARLRRWVAAGLIAPIASEHRLDYFDFRQVANARRLLELLAAGTSLAAIRSGIEQIGRLMPVLETEALAPLERLEHDGRLLIRLDERLVDTCGQRHFDFTESDEATLRIAFAASEDEAVARFNAALAAEDRGEHHQAAELYRQAIALDDGDPVLHFNLGNVLYHMHDYAAARDAYAGALRLDPQYVEALNNLGNTLARLGRNEEAAATLRRALQLVPDYAAAHGSLADVLDRLGDRSAAALHRRKMQPAKTAPWLRVVADEDSP